MAVPFSSLYEMVRVASGNDDPDLGTEVMPDTRIDVLLRSAVRTITSYADSMSHMDYRLNNTDPTAPFYEFFNFGDSTFALPVSYQMTMCLAYAAAQKFYIGIGNAAGAYEMNNLIYQEAENMAGETMLEINAGNIGRYKVARAQQLNRQTFNFT